MVLKEKTRSEVAEQDKWDLTRFIKDEKKFYSIKERLDANLKKVLSYKGNIMKGENSFYEYLVLDEEIDRDLTNLYVYAHLLCDEDSTNTEAVALKMKSEKIMEEVSETLSFASPEIIKAGYKMALAYISKNEKLKSYSFAIEKLFRYEKYTLSEKEEEIISKALSAFGTPEEAFYNLNNTDIDLGTIKDENGEDVVVTNSSYGILITSKDREIRKNAFHAMYHFWKKHNHTVSALQKGMIKENFFLSKVKGFASPLERSLYSDNIPLSLYKNVIKITHDNLALLHEYMRVRKEALRLNEIHMYDVYVPITKNIDKKFTFEEGKDMVLAALRPLGNQYIEDLKKSFSERWIDKYPNKGKKSGAYQWSTYDSTPYVLLNYTGDIDAVSTMAHELGHAMHSYYSKKHQSYTYHNYPIFLAEIASTVNEVLLNDYLYHHTENEEEKKFYLVDMLDTIRTTIYRQTQFAEFEMLTHEKEAGGSSLTSDLFNQIYYDLNKKYYGEYIISDEEIKYEWSRIPHFYSSFYVYKYATGLACAIHIASRILDGDEEMKKGYLEFLSSGGKDYPLEILKTMGIDLNGTEVMQSAFDFFKKKLEELKKLEEK